MSYNSEPNFKESVNDMYTFENTERTNQIASEFETKSLLYLLSLRNDSNHIEVFIIDCFNDVTGSNNNINRLWDVQSKGVKSLNPKKVGISLATLYKNYISSIQFEYYILFIPKLKEGYLSNEQSKNFNFTNFLEKHKKKVKLGLYEESIRRGYIKAATPIDNTTIGLFLNLTSFVIADEEKENYTKNIIDFKNKEVKNKEFFIELFNEIRDMQSILKNECIEGITISNPQEILKYNKIIRKNDIEILTINRLIGIDIFNNRNVPISFLTEIKSLDEEEIRDIIQECNEQISRTFFNKNNKKFFWILLEKIVSVIRKYPKKNNHDIMNLIPKKVVNNIHTLDETSCLYLISLIKEGLRNGN